MYATMRDVEDKNQELGGKWFLAKSEDVALNAGKVIL